MTPPPRIVVSSRPGLQGGEGAPNTGPEAERTEACDFEVEARRLLELPAASATQPRCLKHPRDPVLVAELLEQRRARSKCELRVLIVPTLSGQYCRARQRPGDGEGLAHLLGQQQACLVQGIRLRDVAVIE